LDVIIGLDFYHDIVGTKPIWLERGLVLLDSSFGYILSGCVFKDRPKTASDTGLLALVEAWHEEKRPMPNYTLALGRRRREVSRKRPLVACTREGESGPRTKNYRGRLRETNTPERRLLMNHGYECQRHQRVVVPQDPGPNEGRSERRVQPRNRRGQLSRPECRLRSYFDDFLHLPCAAAIKRLINR